MDRPPARRKNQIPDGPRAVKKSISFREDLYDAIVTAAREERHNNVSRIVAVAVADYLNRRNDVRVA